MKSILVTGENSYIGKNFGKWLNDNYRLQYKIKFISLKNDLWKKTDFSTFDIVFHVAGIAHIKENSQNSTLYYKVNSDLSYEVAVKSKMENVKQFIFLSSMSVFGIETGRIDKNTIPVPKNSYGKSKLQAEELITSLKGEHFKVAIIRPPMVYGKGCKGNYPRLVSLANKTPIFPNIENKRSMIYIDNLSEFIRLIIDNEDSGIFHPQNEEYVCTSELVRFITKLQGKKLVMPTLFNPILNRIKLPLVNKVIGSLVYEKEMSKYKENYCKYNLQTSIMLTQGEINNE